MAFFRGLCKLLIFVMVDPLFEVVVVAAFAKAIVEHGC